jgi:WD40 repeat protein
MRSVHLSISSALVLWGCLPFALCADSPAGLDRLDPTAIPKEEYVGTLLPELVGVLGHHAGRLWSMPLCAAYSPDGKILATGGDVGDPAVTLWDAATMRRTATLTGHKLAIYHVAFSFDAKALVSCDLSGTLHLWDLAKPRPQEKARYQVPKAGRRWRVAFAPDAPILAAANGTEVVRLLDVSRSPAIEKTVLRNPCGVYRVAFGGSGQALAALGLDQTLRLWDLTRAQPRVAWELPLRDSANSVAFSPDGKVLAVGSGTSLSVGRNRSSALL